MRAEKQNISNEYLSRLNASPFFIVVDYRGLKVGPGSQSFANAWAEAGSGNARCQKLDFPKSRGQGGRSGRLGRDAWPDNLAVVTGQQDVSARGQDRGQNFRGLEFEKPKTANLAQFEEPASGKRRHSGSLADLPVH